MVKVTKKLLLSRDASAPLAAAPKKAAVFIDFDGTICPHDVTDLLLENFASPEWEQLESDWLAGKIGARECLSKQIELIKAAPEAVDAFLDKVAIDGAFPQFMALLQAENVPAAIVSDGLDYSIHHILRARGLDDIAVFSNHLVYRGARSWRLEFPYKNKACPAGHCKCRRFDILPRRRLTVYIGDGASDFCPAAKADIVFAKGKLAAFCKKQQINHVEIQGFADIMALWPQLDALVKREDKTAGRAQVAS